VIGSQFFLVQLSYWAVDIFVPALEYCPVLGIGRLAQNQMSITIPFKQQLIGLCSRAMPCDVACVSLLQPTLSFKACRGGQWPTATWSLNP